MPDTVPTPTTTKPMPTRPYYGGVGPYGGYPSYGGYPGMGYANRGYPGNYLGGLPSAGWNAPLRRSGMGMMHPGYGMGY